ncbi:protein SHORTAGE IN CHIASMATA 1 [Cynara cardunculus var. scolymus]|uniref:protein SHORTAGE IN CHIASMATA 1 n=1 Tax=Cynara cardunculus var. scolymus TaxID=59895 RepID=UPI000D623D26|nr:protein SHORTAGE IN CHIASMATA 1 [Cynara cardunculus var. scolymus]
MRTRFSADFFSSSASSQSLQTLDFLRFPPPQLSSPDLFNFDNLSCFDQVTSLYISPQIERFSVSEALSKFFSDVLPQDINAEIDQQIAREVTSEKQIDDNSDGAANNNFTVVKFESPELCISLEDSCLLHEETMQFFFEVADAEVCPELLDFSLEVQQLMDTHKSIFSVEDFCLEFQEEHESDVFENGSLVQGQISSKLRTYPLLEVDETSLGISSYISKDKHLIFESNEPQKWMQKDESTCDAKELLLSMEFDIWEHFLNHSLVPYLKFEIPCGNFAPELVDGFSSLTLSPFAFEQLQFFDTKTSHCSEMFFDTEIISDVEYCEQMFGDTTLSTFNSLIVTHELILRDDSFKSLPVPIISDQEKILSIQVFVDEMLQKLKMQASSASDGIYLDWHLLEEDIYTRNRSSFKMFEDIDTYCIEVDMDSCNSRMLTLEFVLSDACSDEKNTEENTEVLNIQMNSPSSGNSMDHVCHDGITSSKLNDICQKMESGEDLLDNKVNKAHQLVESTSQFNDLDFLLNPLEVTCLKKQRPADKRLEMDYALPMISAKGPIETHDTCEKQWQSLENELHSREDLHSTSPLSKRSKNSEGLLCSTPVAEKNTMGSMKATYEVMTSSLHLHVPQQPSALDSKKMSTNMPSLPDAVIVVNTQNVDTEMIVSRRSTYQRILAMEKEGLQVVERDLNLPVDVIVSAAVCLVLYDSKNIRRKTSLDGVSAFLSSCVENIAANVLTSLSFAFSSCILIFEGEVGFLASIMESSDGLYAAASSLGIDLQLFCSYSSEITDEIILKCIAHAAKSTRGLYPKMPESETLAESFLTKFPSINPLSAHAILSSVGTLVEFLEMSHQQRVCAVQKYLVPDASTTLFSALCRYGEREDSRSGMTDCCSSVSEGHDSGNCCPKSDHEKKKRKYVSSPEARAMSMDYLFQVEQNNDVTCDPPKTANSHSYWNLEAEEISDDIVKSNTAFDEIYFGENQRSALGIMLNPSSLAKPCNIRMSEAPEVSGEINLPDMTVIETSFGQSKKVHMPTVNKLGSHTDNNSKGLHEGFKGEVIDIDDDAMAGEWCSLPSFPSAADINSDLDFWIDTKHNGQSSREEITLNSHADLMNNGIPLEQLQISSEECLLVNSPVDSCRPSFKGKDPHYGRTPLSKAIFSAQPQKGSPWTIDFLNRIKEKSRLRQQSVPCISSAPCFGYSGNSSKFRKRKSPSILDFYRYQRSSTVQSMEHKGQKVPIQPSNSSKSVNTSPSSSQTWTPIDKRAKRRLTFATNGSKGQSKLIWSDKTNQTQKRR